MRKHFMTVVNLALQGVVNGPLKLKIRVSQNIFEISQVSQSRFLRGLSASRSLKVLQGS